MNCLNEIKIKIILRMMHPNKDNHIKNFNWWSGFIGSALVRHITNYTEHTIINVDKLSYAASLMSLESVKDNARYFFESRYL